MEESLTTKQTFKAVYFPDIKDRSTTSKSVTLAFTEQDHEVFDLVKNLSSLEMRKVIGIETFGELEKIAEAKNLTINRYCIWKLKTEYKKPTKLKDFKLDPIHTTFQGGKEMPLQNWYPYLEGYSPDFVNYIIDNYLENDPKVIYDPFSGSGTTPMTASSRGLTAYYSEVNPFLQFLTGVKTKARNCKDRKRIIGLLEAVIESLKPEILFQIEDEGLRKTYNETFGKSKFFSQDVFSYILKTRSYLNQLYFKDVFLSELVTVAALSSLIENSFLKRQGDLRFRRGDELEELKNQDFFASLTMRLQRIIDDLKIIQPAPAATLITEDARTIGKLPFIGIDAVITSPPYLNGTNYFRNTKVELWFLGYLKNQDHLANYRRLAVTAGINDVSQFVKKTVSNLDLVELLKKLEQKAYDKRIPKMVHDYFADMDVIFRNLKQQLNPGAILAIDLGDSIYGGIHVKTHEILISILKNLGYSFEKEIILRKRQSKNGSELKQVLLIFKNPKKQDKKTSSPAWKASWANFITEMPHHHGEMSKRNWGDPMHSLCSYQGKLKPSIAHQLVSIFVPEQGKVLDLFGGVGTIPLEAALQNKKSISFDISPAAIAISHAKLTVPSRRKVTLVLDELEEWISHTNVEKTDLASASKFGFNKTLKDYFHPDTFNEILTARKFFQLKGYEESGYSLAMSALLHILHGNRPYALSRRSHGITPFAPTGDFEYKNLMTKLREKINRSTAALNRSSFQQGDVYFQDATKTWPSEVQDLDAIITSPPFFDSTRFYAANWMRLWFAGWDDVHFKTQPVNFIDELQKKDLSVYDSIFMQARGRLKDGGVFVMHLGKSKKCDMAHVLGERAKKWFQIHDVFEESVEDAESHGIKDRGAVTKHQYLVLG